MSTHTSTSAGCGYRRGTCGSGGAGWGVRPLRQSCVAEPEQPAGSLAGWAAACAPLPSLPPRAPPPLPAPQPAAPARLRRLAVAARGVAAAGGPPRVAALLAARLASLLRWAPAVACTAVPPRLACVWQRLAAMHAACWCHLAGCATAACRSRTAAAGEGEDVWPEDLPQPPMHSHSRRSMHANGRGASPTPDGSSNPYAGTQL